MSKQPSVETQLKRALAEIRRLERDRKEAQSELTRVRFALQSVRTQEAQSRQEAAEWRARFDLLLAKVPAFPPQIEEPKP